MVTERAAIFQMHIPWGKTFPLVPRSSSSVKVKVKYGHNYKKKKPNTCGSCGGIRVSQTHLVPLCF